MLGIVSVELTGLCYGGLMRHSPRLRFVRDDMTIKTEYLDIASLDASDHDAWRGLQASDPALASPYFSMTYARAANTARPGVKILKVTESGAPIAYWPLRPGPLGTARPVGGPMDDLHGIVAAPDTRLDLTRIAAAKGIGGYTFSATPFTQVRHGLKGQTGNGNQVMDLSTGYAAWLAERQDDSSNFRREHRKVEKLLTDPSVRIAHDVVDHEAFDRMIALKRKAYRESGHFDLFSLGWPRKLLETLQSAGAEDARGVLSTLRVDGALAAVVYCMRSASVLHYWFPAYEDEYSKLKPGLALLFSLAEWAAGEGIRELHLGLGETRYKRQMSTWMMPVRSGAVAFGLPQKLATQAYEAATRLEPKGRFLELPAKIARKYDRMVLAGNWKA